MIHVTRVSRRNAATGSSPRNPTISSWDPLLIERRGSWRADGTVECGKAECAALPEKWTRIADNDLSWPAVQDMECSPCKSERDRRNRVMAGDDPRVRKEPYLSAPFSHKNKKPMYHAMLLRAHAQAKMLRKHVLWLAAMDTP